MSQWLIAKNPSDKNTVLQFVHRAKRNPVLEKSAAHETDIKWPWSEDSGSSIREWALLSRGKWVAGTGPLKKTGTWMEIRACEKWAKCSCANGRTLKLWRSALEMICQKKIRRLWFGMSFITFLLWNHGWQRCYWPLEFEKNYKTKQSNFFHLNAGFVNNKVDVLEIMLQSTNVNFDVVILIETW